MSEHIDRHDDGGATLAYADPPYVGQAKRHYADDPRASEVNLPLLIAYLDEFDGWALSCSSPSLRTVLPLCPVDVRVMAWVKPFAVFRPHVNPAYAWEPVIVQPARKPGRDRDTVRDWVSANITMRKGTHGAKPAAFARWLFLVLGAEPFDEFYDLFPGSGVITTEWHRWATQPTLDEAL